MTRFGASLLPAGGLAERRKYGHKPACLVPSLAPAMDLDNGRITARTGVEGVYRKSSCTSLEWWHIVSQRASRLAAFWPRGNDGAARSKRVCEPVCRLACHAQLERKVTGAEEYRHGSRESMRIRSNSGESARVRKFYEEGQLEKALEALLRMDQQGTGPSVQTYRYLLQACSVRKALDQAIRVHAHITEHGLETDVCLSETVVCTLVKCGGLVHALEVFRGLPVRTVSSWNAVLSSYIKGGQGGEAWRMYEQMMEQGVQPNRFTFLTIIKACCSSADLAKGKQIHADIVRHSCLSDVFVGNSLIHMYASCGSIVDARGVFDSLCERSVVSWNAMISGYADQGDGDSAWQLYSRMQDEGIKPDARTFVSVLKACRSLAVHEGNSIAGEQSVKAELLRRVRAIYAEVVRIGQPDVYVGSSLVNMFASCGSMTDAQGVFEMLPERNVVSWNAMIARYAELEHGEEALQLYFQMLDEGITPTDRTFVCALKACISLAGREPPTLIGEQTMKLQTLQKGKRICADAVQRGYGSDFFVGSSIIGMYASCGSIAEARDVFDTLSQRNVMAWNAMIAGYVADKQNEEALQLFSEMRREAIQPDSRTFVNVLKACSNNSQNEQSVLVNGQDIKAKSLQQGMTLYDEATQRGYGSNLFVMNTLIDMYAKCGSIADARRVFDTLPERNLVSWNSMIAGYAEGELGDKALELYHVMQREGARPDIWTMVSLLKACSSLAIRESSTHVQGQTVKVKSLRKGNAIYAHAVRDGYASDAYIINSAIDMYAKCGCLVDARSIFDNSSQRNIVSWNAMIAGYVEQEKGEQALQVYFQMQENVVKPDLRTFISVLKACSIIATQEEDTDVNIHSVKRNAFQIGKALHAEVARRGYESDLFIGSSLLNMYANCGSITHARQVFDSMSQRNVVSWNAMIAGYTQLGFSKQGLQLFAQMREEGIQPNSWTFVSAIKACADNARNEAGILLDGHSIKVESLRQGKAIHVEVVQSDYGSDGFVGNSLIAMFANCGSIQDACLVFDTLPQRNVVSWNAMIAGYCELEHYEKALQLYTQMQEARFRPDEATFLCILRACSNVGALDVCVQIHRDVIGNGYQLTGVLASALCHAYCKCGSMADAQKAFDSMLLPGVIAWNTLISGYARQGECDKSFQCFERMQQAGVKPDAVTFVSLLSACTHACMVVKGVGYFESMAKDHGVIADMEHYAGMVDLLGRAGLLGKAEQLALSMPMQPSVSVWLSLLGSCRKYGNVEMGRRAFDSLVFLEPKHAAAHMIMSTIYSQAGMWDCVKEIDVLRQEVGAHKKPGLSWIECNHEVHQFLVGDSRHRQKEQIYRKVAELRSQMKAEGSAAE